MKIKKCIKSSSLPNLLSNTKSFNETFNSTKDQWVKPSLDTGFNSTAFTFHKNANNPTNELGQFFFMYNDDKEVNEETKHRNQKESKDILNKLSQWDKEHLILNKKENPKHYKVFTSFIDSKKENVNKNNPQNETIFRSISGLDTSNVHKHERILGQMKKKTPTRYQTRNPFNFEAFTQNRSSNEYINQKLIEDEELTKSKNEKDYYHEFLKEQMRTEAKSREKLMETYQRIILLKLKREKYEKILDDTYHLLDNAKTEYFLCTDILKERIKSVSKYYEAFRESNRLGSVESSHSNNVFTDDNNLSFNHNPSMSQSNSTNSVNSASNNSLPANRKEITNYRYKSNFNSPNSRVNGSRFRARKGVIYDLTKETKDTALSKESKEAKINRQKKTLLDIYEEKMKKYREYVAIVEDINKEIKAYESKFNEIKSELLKIIEDTSMKISSISKQGRENKLKFEAISNEQRAYYKEILKLGFDTRSEGLSWVIKRLLELNVPLEPNLFPNYLDSDQIEFLINISKLGFENTQLKLALQTLKLRQQRILDSNNQKRMDKITKFSMEKANKTIASFIEGEMKSNLFSKENLKKLEDIYIRHHQLMKSSIQNKIEENEVLTIVETIKRKLCSFAYCPKSKKSSFWTDEEDNNNVVRFLLEHEKQKEYFEDILVLRARIKELDSFIHKLIIKEVESFKEKFKYIKKKQSEKASAYYERVYAALFGNTIVL